jgi:hypothetical protein
VEPELDPDVPWVQELAACDARTARRAIEEAEGERKLYSHLAREHAREGRDAYGEIDAPLELFALVRLLRPRHVLEVGVSSGVSSGYLLQALERNGFGTLHSVDLPQKPARRRPGAGPPRSSWTLPPGRSPGWAVPLSLRKRWDLRLGDKADVIPLFPEELPSLEMFVYDVPHRCEVAWNEFRRIDPLLRSGGVAIVDHGPGGSLCPSLRKWARQRGARPAIRRSGTGLFGARLPPASPRVSR